MFSIPISIFCYLLVREFVEVMNELNF